MNAISHFKDRRPLTVGLLALLTWLVLAMLLIGAVSFLFRMPIAEPFVQAAGTLSATGVLLWIAFRLGWLGTIGITNLGTLPTWGVTLLIGVYVVVSGWYAFFGEIAFELGSLVSTPESRAILGQTVLVGFVEETVFRGIVLYALVRVWGQTRRGLVAAVLVQAALFGTLHALQALFGVTPEAALANVVATFVFGVWLGAFVLSVGTLWPAIALHAASNCFLLIKGLSSPWITPDFLGYVRGAFVDLPLVLLGLWIMLKLWCVRQPAQLEERYLGDSRAAG